MDETTYSLTDIIKNSINDILSQIFSSIDNNLYSILDRLTFVDTSILESNHITKILGSSPTEESYFYVIACFLDFLFIMPQIF